MGFDPSFCGFGACSSAPSIAPLAPPPPPVVPSKRPLEPPVLPPGPPPLAPPKAALDDSSVPSSLPVFTLPAGFQFECSGDAGLDASLLPPPPRAAAPLRDPRRAALERFRDKRWPLAGLMREEGGVFAFIDAVRQRNRS